MSNNLSEYLFKIATLESEIKYYKSVVEEQKAVIKQLDKGPGEYEYIHPYDLAVLVNDLNSPLLEMYTSRVIEDANVIEIDNKKYIQSAYMPVRTKAYA